MIFLTLPANAMVNQIYEINRKKSTNLLFLLIRHYCLRCTYHKQKVNSNDMDRCVVATVAKLMKYEK